LAQKVDARFPPKLSLLFKKARYKVLYGGRGGSKSWGIARALLILGTQRPIRILCARELQNSIDDSVHTLLSDQVSALGLDSFYEIQSKTIIGINGTKINYEGLRQNIKKIKSYEAVDYVWVEEAEAVSKSSWATLIPTIRKESVIDMKYVTSEIWVSFNPEFEDDETYERFVLDPPDPAPIYAITDQGEIDFDTIVDYMGPYVQEINWRDNPWFPGVLNAERLQLKKRDPDAYDHVWEGKCRKWLEGAIYANELRAVYDEKRVLDVEFDPNVPVHTAWDIGHTDDTAIWWFQVVMNEVHILECISFSGGDPSYFASQILGKKVFVNIEDGRIKINEGEDIPELAHRREYQYGVHWLPHDARAKTFSAHGKSTQQQLQAAIGNIRITPSLSREDGIKVARTTFPNCYFDKTGCSEGLKALRKYRRELQKDEISLQLNPKHDWSSNLSDGFRYLAIVWHQSKGYIEEVNPRRDSYDLDFDDDNEISWKTA